MSRVRNGFLFKHKGDGVDVRVNFMDNSYLIGKVVDFDNETLMIRSTFAAGESLGENEERELVLNLDYIYMLQTAPKDEPAVRAIGVLREEGRVE